MESEYKKALEFSNYQHSLTLKKNVLKEKIDATLTMGYAGGLFKVSSDLIVFVEFLIKRNKTENIVLLDCNNNPILIDDLTVFQEEILDRYFTSTNQYYKEYENLKKQRSVETLIND